MADPRLNHHPGAPLRRRRPQKWDGTGGQDEQALGRSRGGFGTKIHGAISGLGLPDKGYDSRAVVEAIEAQGAEAVIPSLKNRAEQRDYDRERYKDRNLVERFWFKVKQYRRVATRYEKTARNFLGFVHVASIMILLK